MGSKLIYRMRQQITENTFNEIKIWAVEKTEDKSHGYKYSFVHVKDGKRIIGYDNAEGKGDHRHYEDREATYEFISIKKLFADFYKDVKERL